MKATEIEKVNLAAFDMDAVRSTLAAEAESLLGYSTLQKYTPGSLLAALKKLEIDPLKTLEVRKYMASKTYKTMWSGKKRGIAMLASIPALIYLASMFFEVATRTHKDLVGVGGVVCVVGCVCCFILGLFNLVDNDHRGRRTVQKWDVCGIRGYSGFVPEFALEMAVQIRKECPEAYFHVHQLVREQEVVVRLPDPFLEVIDGSENYFIAVWDEKEYERVL